MNEDQSVTDKRRQQTTVTVLYYQSSFTLSSRMLMLALSFDSLRVHCLILIHNVIPVYQHFKKYLCSVVFVFNHL